MFLSFPEHVAIDNDSYMGNYCLQTTISLISNEWMRLQMTKQTKIEFYRARTQSFMQIRINGFIYLINCFHCLQAETLCCDGFYAKNRTRDFYTMHHHNYICPRKLMETGWTISDETGLLNIRALRDNTLQLTFEAGKVATPPLVTISLERKVNQIRT